MSRRSLLTVFLALVIFAASAASYTYPVMKKGYVPWSDNLTLIEARNKALAGTYSYESDKGVFLSSEHAGQAIVTGVPNPLTAVIYGYIFKVFGFRQIVPLVTSILLFSCANVLLFLLVARIFSLTTGFAAATVSTLMPIMASAAVAPGFYEWALLFFVIGLWLFLNPPKLFHAGLPRLIGASLFFAFASLARNAFAVSFIPFFLYDLYVRRSWKRSLALAVPFLMLFGSTLTPLSWLGVPNGYTATVNQPYQQIGHVFNDPYSYYFNRDESIKAILNTPGALDRVAIKFTAHWGYHITLGQHMKAMVASVFFYGDQLIYLITTGGFFVLLLAALGGFVLYKTRRDLFWFFATWFVLWLGYLVFTESGNADHFIEIVFILSVLAGMGAVELMGTLQQVGVRRGIAVAGVVIVLFGHLLSADKWKFHDTYRSSVAGKAHDLVSLVGAQPSGGVIAIGIHPEAAYAFAYESNRDTVFFNPVTVSDLIRKGKLKEVFNLYHVTTAIGYDADLSAQIKTLTGEPVILSDPSTVTP